MCCSVLQCVAVCHEREVFERCLHERAIRLIKCVAVCCSVLQCVEETKDAKPILYQDSLLYLYLYVCVCGGVVRVKRALSSVIAFP